MMKQLVLMVLSLAVFSLLNDVYGQQTTTKQKSKSSNSKFTGKWKGAEKCNDVGAPVALLFVTASGADVLLTGIYSIQGQIKATIKGDTIVIPQQEVIDPNFMNLVIEGKLAFGTKPFSLAGKITVLNNQKKDECLVKYYK